MDTKRTPMISPLPWEGGTCHITDATGETVAQCFRSLSGDKQANSDLIVRACNSHDQLAAALELVMTWIDNWSPAFTDDAEWGPDLAKIRAALAAAGT